MQVLAHDLARWTATIGLGAGIVTTKTLRRRFLAIPGRLTRSARHVKLHLPEPMQNIDLPTDSSTCSYFDAEGELLSVAWVPSSAAA